MDATSKILCGCKGIRTCLLCEEKKNLSNPLEIKEDRLVYHYCHHCNTCWRSVDGRVNCGLNGIILIPEFVSEEEEDELVSGIDKIPWMPSQSGRRKQDFGPKANFKKRKLRIGTFSGFPSFATKVIQRFSEVKQLSDFKPVELCHLEYVPERGSAIEPHLDDSWLWGEHLVTLNFESDTILTLTPHLSEDSAECGCFKSFLASYPSETVARDCHRCFESNVLMEKHDLSIASEDIEVHIHLPRRSLLVLFGCARYHWCHEIKRCHIAARRVAMTFRELSQVFMEGGLQYKEGLELLNIAKEVIDVES